MRALVTGSHGFAGQALCRQLEDAAWSVTGLGLSDREAVPPERYVRCDLLDRESLAAALDEADPAVVFHLAGRSGRGGPDEARRTLDANAAGTRNLVHALAARDRPVRVIVAGSSAQYGTVPPDCDPVDESAPPAPLGVYGWSKLVAEATALAHGGNGPIEVIATRPFNHAGPGEPEHLVCSAFARGIARVESGAERHLDVGSLDTVRDFTDVRDVARAYFALAERGTPGRVYNICSGRGTRVGDVLRMLLDKTGVTVEVRADAEKPAGLPRQIGSFERIERDTGWAPTIPLEQTLQDLLQEWRARLGVTTSRGNGS